jgi:hypothetical protein
MVVSPGIQHHAMVLYHQEINIMTSGMFFKGKVCFNPRLIQALIILVLIIIWRNNFRMHSSLLQGQDIRQVDDAPSTSGSSLSSGVGIATTDGAWGDSGKHKYDRQDIKIMGFTDRNYLPIAKLWYSRLAILVSLLHESVHPSSRVPSAYSKNRCKQTDFFISHFRDIPSTMLWPTTCKFPPFARV